MLPFLCENAYLIIRQIPFMLSILRKDLLWRRFGWFTEILEKGTNPILVLSYF